MSLDQRKVKKLYIEGKSAKEISKLTGVSTSSIYRWINDPALEFKKSKELAEFDTGDMATIIDESHKKLLMKISENPDDLLDPKTADALCKVAKILESLDAKATREKIAEEEETQEVKGVLIIDDITLEFIEKKASEDIQTTNS